MMREFNVQANVGKPQVAYRETITIPAEQRHRFVRQTGGKGMFADVTLRVEPQEPGKGFEFENEIVGGAIPKEFIPAVEKGVEEAMRSGVVAGYPMVDIKVTLLDGSYHEVDSSEMAFKIAGSMAFKEACAKAKPRLLEPIIDVEVVVPEEYMGDIIGDLSSRRGRIGGMFTRGPARVDRGVGAAGRDVRLRHAHALDLAGARGVLDAVLALRDAAAGGGRGDRGEGQELEIGTAPRRASVRAATLMCRSQARRFVHGQAEVRAHEAARERGDDRARGPREDDADGGDHDGAGAEQPEDPGAGLRLDRQRAGRAGARDHDRDGARGVRDGQAALRARGLPGARGLREEHDHGSGADGRGDPGGVGGGRADAADARAHAAGAAGGGAVHRGVHEQVRHGGRPGAAGPGGAGGAGAAEEVRVPGGRDSGDPGLGEGGDGRGRQGREGERVDPEADGGGGQLHPDAGAGDRQAVPDAGGGRVLDLGARDGGDGAGGARAR